MWQQVTGQIQQATMKATSRSLRRPPWGTLRAVCVGARPILCGEMLASESAQCKWAGQPLGPMLAEDSDLQSP